MPPPMCMLSQPGAGPSPFRGPPVPLILVPVVIHLVRTSCDAKMTNFIKEVASRGGPTAVAESAHRVAQYVLSKVPSDLLWWFTSRVLELPPEVALRTTELLKSRTELDAAAVMDAEPRVGGRVEGSEEVVPVLGPGDVERRLEELERRYLALQERHEGEMRLLAENSGSQSSLNVLSSPAVQVQEQEDQPQDLSTAQTMQIMKLDSHANVVHRSGATDGQSLLQDVGLRLGRILLEWAGETIKQRLVNTPAARQSGSSNQAFTSAGVDLAEKLIGAIAT